MDSLNYWRLCDELSVIQTALLIVGVDPSSNDGAYCDGWEPQQQPQGYRAAKAALVHAINAGRLPAAVRHEAREYGYADYMADIEAGEANYENVTGSTVAEDEEMAGRCAFIYKKMPDWNLTTVSVEALRSWLAGRGFRTGFFFPQVVEGEPDFLSPGHPRYAPKLAAAVKAWTAVNDPGGKSPKQALVKWLRENSASFELSDDEGKPNEQGIEECAKVANWQRGGGAIRTPAA